MLYKWQQELADKGDAAFQGAGRNAIKKGSVEALERENRRLREEVEILKKAAAYFAKDMKWSTRLLLHSVVTIASSDYVPHWISHAVGFMHGVLAEQVNDNKRMNA